MSNYRIFPICEPDINITNRNKEIPCQYILFGEEKIQNVPNLEDIMNDKSVGPFNKGNLVQYLSNSHCLENYEFVVFMNKFLAETRIVEKKNTWQYILMTFLLEDALKEINLPCDIRNGLLECEEEYPREDLAMKAKMIIYDLLCDSYHEFVKLMKLQIHADCCKHKIQGCSQEAGELESYRPKGHSFAFELFSPLSSLHAVDFDDSDVNEITHTNSMGASRHNSTGSRGSSIGSLVDSLKNNDLVNWRKTVKKLKIRRFLNEI